MKSKEEHYIEICLFYATGITNTYDEEILNKVVSNPTWVKVTIKQYQKINKLMRTHNYALREFGTPILLVNPQNSNAPSIGLLKTEDLIKKIEEVALKEEQTKKKREASYKKQEEKREAARKARELKKLNELKKKYEVPAK